MFKVKAFHDLTLDELYQILKARVDVFVVEQNCPYKEVDGIDDQCFHLFTEEEGELTSYCRLIPPGVMYNEPSIGRILVQPNFRKQKLGRQLLTKAIETAKITFKRTDIKIHAQVYLFDFYRSFGFIPVSEEYLEDGILHVDMVLEAFNKPLENRK
ncbi:GNAT family acetyltransferase [Halolactibacillus alkaliphilus]|uniref:GNAT family acetyltransferase n=1 Tax=Halolactibacillus alkaliphilus TaxID=442899 RepID=A0A511X0Z9_9BACI|nr:GNAT family N-acetyltransferase [Halolactibacillus alkaliphilus]GEN56601.1 GNAT family acetyltransferase [Halolactibacillus alkaliphilus]GGN69720.1 GNAT family acetyltransferase [Halolactibacillus alkaliphilus]SFO76270.1 ElaA protein [Halolactibacillus alkaliphilus]